MLASRRWRDWSPEKTKSERLSTQLTEPTKTPTPPILSVLSVHTLGVLNQETASDDPVAVDPEAWRAPFVAWLDRYYTLHLGKQTGTGFRNLARHYREWEEGNGRSCSEAVCRAMLEELCFEIRTVQGVEMVQGLVLKSDLEACKQ